MVNYLKAVSIYNKKNRENDPLSPYCTPKKGTPEYDAVMIIVNSDKKPKIDKKNIPKISATTVKHTGNTDREKVNLRPLIMRFNKIVKSRNPDAFSEVKKRGLLKRQGRITDFIKNNKSVGLKKSDIKSLQMEMNGLIFALFT